MNDEDLRKWFLARVEVGKSNTEDKLKLLKDFHSFSGLEFVHISVFFKKLKDHFDYGTVKIKGRNHCVGIRLAD